MNYKKYLLAVFAFIFICGVVFITPSYTERRMINFGLEDKRGSVPVVVSPQKEIFIAQEQNGIFDHPVVSISLKDVYGDYTVVGGKVYFGEEIVPLADPGTFKNFGLSGYAKDKNYVYFGTSTIQGADIDTFTIIDDGFFAKDSKYVFLQGEKVPIKFDTQSFKVLNSFGRGGMWNKVIKDINSVYWGHIEEPFHYSFFKAITMDPKTFEYIGYGCWVGGEEGEVLYYFGDKNTIFIENEPKIMFDRGSFKVLDDSGYAKDKNHVYYDCDKVLEDADPLTFSAIGGGYAKDKNHAYYNADMYTINPRIADNVDPQSFEAVSKEDSHTKLFLFYAKDKNHVYKTIPKEGDSENLYFVIIQGVKPADCTIETITLCDPESKK